MVPREALIRAPFQGPVQGLCTTRLGGVSQAPFDSLNLGASVGDDANCVRRNRQRLQQALPGSPCWLEQVHGRGCIHLDDWRPGVQADAAWTDRFGQVAVVLTADCIPILVAADDGACVAAIHAGWRGLSSGVIENSISSLPVAPGRLSAWVGPCIRQDRYEVGPEVRGAFADTPDCFEAGRPGHWWADLAAIAIERLQRLGLGRIEDCGLCTAAQRHLFFSHRRDGSCGRIASLIWLDPS
ncbi:MAG: peptidoglycan editing factor PgeF [Wenzhouxiangellaceae bacterium]|nr:peptidoglycan editing factor PgeF [Wenzhouxiangellaceae bacterium]